MANRREEPSPSCRAGKIIAFLRSIQRSATAAEITDGIGEPVNIANVHAVRVTIRQAIARYGTLAHWAQKNMGLPTRVQVRSAWLYRREIGP